MAKIRPKRRARRRDPPGAAPLSGARPLGRQGQHRQRRPHRARAGVLPAAGARGHAGAGGPPLQGDGERRRAVRAAQSQRAQFPAARRARRRRHHLAQDRRAGQGVLDGAAPDGDPGARGARPAAARAHEHAVGAVPLRNRARGRRPHAHARPARQAERAERRAGRGACTRRSSAPISTPTCGWWCCAGRGRISAPAPTSTSCSRRPTGHPPRTRPPRCGWARLFGRMRRLPKPVVAVVQGRALAGGAGLVTACDLVLAGAGASSATPRSSAASCRRW